MWVTLEETGIGFVIGSVAGVICGIVLGRNKLMADVFGLYIQIANSIPRVVLGSIFVIALGLGMASKIALAVVMVFFVVFGNAFQGVREADRYLIANAQILGASRRQITTSVVIPSALSWILASLHVSFGFALVGAVVGEFLGSKQGIGLLISTAQGAFNASGVFAAMIVLAVVALAADYLLTWLEKRLLKWRPRRSERRRRTPDMTHPTAPALPARFVFRRRSATGWRTTCADGCCGGCCCRSRCSC